ncbi:hypothetical protein OGA59_004466 [Salmonella enterica]|nr:hypothetical protein [Salmonella enterica]
MQFEKNNDIGEFPAISQQLFDFDEPIAKVAMVACHALPHSWGAYQMPNDAQTKCAIFRLEDSPFIDDMPESEVVNEPEEYRPLNGDLWLFDGGSDKLWDTIKNQGDRAFIDSLEYVKLDQDKLFAESLMELHEQGKY